VARIYVDAEKILTIKREKPITVFLSKLKSSEYYV
jgi:hypothetical protein